MRRKFTIFRHIISINPERDTKMSITENLPKIKFKDDTKWELLFPIEKRIYTYTKHKGVIDHLFRNCDYTLMNGDAALLHLKSILVHFRNIRDKFEKKGATPKQLKLFDDKIYKCFNTSFRIVKERTEEFSRIENEELKYNLEILNKLNLFNIKDNYK